MKLVLRILNLVLAAIAGVAVILLFSMPAFSFNSKVVVDVNKFSGFIPETQYTKDIDVVDTLGTDEIQVSIKFKLSATDINKVMNGDHEIINNNVILNNLDETLKTLDDAVDVLADNTIRKTLQNVTKTEITNQIERSKPENNEMTTEQIMEMLELDDVYFQKFAYSLYDEANTDSSTVDGVNALLQEQIDETLTKAEKTGAIKSGTYTQDQKDQVKANLVNILNQLEMIKADGEHLEKISDLPYMYITKYIKQQLNGKVSATELERKADETNKQHSTRLLETFVLQMMPDIFYNIVGYVSLGMFIGLMVFAVTWIALAAFEVLHFLFFRRKHKLFSGLFVPFFFLMGILQVALGFVLTGVCKYVLPAKLNLASFGLPLKNIILVPRTATLATSIVFIITVGVGIAYFILKFFLPKEEKKPE